MILAIFILFISLSAQARDPVIVAVVDMGIDSNKNKEFNPYLIPGWDFGSEHRSVGVDYNQIYDHSYHGTLIAGLIVRKLSPEKVKILDIVYSDYYGEKFKLNEYLYAENMLQVYRRKRAYQKFTEHLKEVFQYAKMNKASVINFSSSDPGFNGEELSRWIEENPETIMIVSAGNDGDDLDTYPQYPCGYKSVICVGAVDKGKRASYSNYGKTVHIFAQGSYSKEVKGTSFSAPVISRAAAIIKYHHPEWNVSRVKKELYKFSRVEKKMRIFDEEKFTKTYY